jgi:ATP-dependent Clp protease ATP-binding subunit ClpB
LTDSRGQTVFFSETVIVFTSNIGTRTQDNIGKSILDKERDKIDLILKDQSQTPETRRELIHQHFSGAVRDFFMFEISRPELLNRIGDNIIPFNYIDNSEMQGKIIQSHLARIKRDFEDKFISSGYKLELSDSLRNYFITKYSKVISNFGGRAITNAIEDEIMKPLAKSLLRAEFNGSKNMTFKVKDENGKIAVIN